MNVNDTNNQRMLPVLPLRGLTAFPDMLIHFDVGRAMSIKALEAAMKDGQWIFLTAQKDLKTDRPTADDLYEVGTICIIKQILRLPGDNIRVLVEGKDRARALHYQKSEDGGECLKAQVEVLYDCRSAVSAASRHSCAPCRTALRSTLHLHPVCRPTWH